jgi:hypothetical protein
MEPIKRMTINEVVADASRDDLMRAALVVISCLQDAFCVMTHLFLKSQDQIPPDLEMELSEEKILEILAATANLLEPEGLYAAGKWPESWN